MRNLKKYLNRILVSGILLFIFKGFLYRNLVAYTKIETRKNYAITNKNIIQSIEKYTNDEELTIDDIIEISNKITSKELEFTLHETSNNPNLNFETNKANCIGYSSLFNAVGNYILQQQNLSETYEFRHVVGKMKFLGYDIHNIFKSPFFKDHDYNEIINKKIGAKHYVDPSLYDYTWINRVTAN
ncbi:hypothetical protein IMCC3317_14160 [Kordia antarctica]|uniref:Uncharacterized protein n=1 Tax=Kordia antarctica TaxID=1218801 RepID=A0A7L4ZH60_9FLAO|nr:hypothetical protein [Kordia antarctica]QHI36063.1 hypothetical protein IMCC3317_14160 [Kordia antarctica]